MLSYTDIGCFDSEVIVFIHGLGSRKEAWKPQAELGFNYRLVIPDLRGHGETELEGNISIKNFAKDVIELLDSLHIKQAFICGLSLGGIVAQEIYRMRPELVKGLILANTASYISTAFASGVIMNAYCNHKKDNFIDQIVDRGLYNKDYSEAAKEAFLIRDSYMESLIAPLGINYFPLLMTVDKPVLLISSDHDRVTPAINQLWMLAACMKVKRVRRIMLKNTGHLSNIDNPYEFNEAINQFIEEVIG